jgi:hypothetical protein
MLLLAAWSMNGWLLSGHAMRMALDLGLHRALEKLAEQQGNDEERDLGMLLPMYSGGIIPHLGSFSCLGPCLAVPLLV